MGLRAGTLTPRNVRARSSYIERVRRFAASLLFFFAASAGAATVNVSVIRDNAPVANAQVCRFAAAEAENPFRRWLSSQDVTCVAPGALTFERGLWNVFAKADGAISQPVLIDGATTQTIVLELNPAATLNAQLPAGRKGVVYATQSGVAIPIDGLTVVPAGEPLWLIVLDKSTPVAVMQVPAIEARSQRTVDARSGGTGVLLTWILVPEPDRSAAKAAHNLGSPRITFRQNEGVPLPPPQSMHGAFALVDHAAAGDAELQLGGRGWLPYKRRVKIAAQPVTVVEEPLLARGAATVVVNWSVNDDVPRFNRDARGCTDDNSPPQILISLLSCPPARPGERAESVDCSVVRQQTLPPTPLYGSFAIEDVPPGTYRAELKYGHLPANASIVVAPPLHATDVRVISYFEGIYGGVSFGGEPLHKDATIEFVGKGLGFAARDRDDYHGALLRKLETDDIVNVSVCDEPFRAFVLTDRDSLRSSRFDIDIPDNEFTLSITDTFTQMPVPGASVHYTVMSLRVPRRPVLSRTVTPQANSAEPLVKIKYLPERQLSIVVSAPGYEKQALEPLSITKSEKRRVDVKMMPIRGGTAGKVISSAQFDRASIYWFSPGGDLIESADIAPDGSFSYTHSHSAGETVAVVSASHPLWVTRSQETARNATMTLQFPNAPRRSFDVVLNGGKSTDQRYIALVIGGVRVPTLVFLAHANIRRADTFARNGRALIVNDIAQTGPIEIILGPSTDELPVRLLHMDFFALPQFADAPRRPLAADAQTVIFVIP